MRIEEFEEREEIDNNRWFVKVLKHKTVAWREPANVIILQYNSDIMLQYYQYIRKKITPINSQL